MLNPPESVLNQWKALAILYKEKTDKDSLIKLVKSNTGDQFLKRLLDLDIKSVS